MKVRVVVTLLDEIRDPQGEVLTKRLESMGYSEVRNTRVGKAIMLDMDGGDDRTVEERVGKMAKELLANTSTEKFEVEIVDE